MVRVPLLQLMALFAQFLFLGESVNIQYPAFFNFGDSNSDTGGLAAGVAFPLGPPNGQTYFHKPSGRFCDGRLIVDFLMDSVHLPFLKPYLDSVGAPSFETGCNFAAGGSTILPANAASASPFSFAAQVSQFLRFRTRVLELLDEGTKTDKFLPPKDYFSQGLYTIDMGQNDLDGALKSKSEDQMAAFISTVISELEAGILRLHEQGARNFWIHSTGPLGCLPRIIATFGNDTSKLDEFGCVNSHNQVAKLFNAKLRNLCKQLQEVFSEFNVTYIDVFTIKSNLISNYSQFGFKQPIAACCGYGGLPLNYDRRISCGQTKILNGSSATAIACSEPGDYVNWDGNHYTEEANFHVSSQILTGNYFDPPVSDMMPLTLEFGLS